MVEFRHFYGIATHVNPALAQTFKVMTTKFMSKMRFVTSASSNYDLLTPFKRVRG
jgi:hypothetical protein